MMNFLLSGREKSVSMPNKFPKIVTLFEKFVGGREKITPNKIQKCELFVELLI
jgi:hypothetical protein